MRLRRRAQSCYPVPVNTAPRRRRRHEAGRNGIHHSTGDRLKARQPLAAARAGPEKQWVGVPSHGGYPGLEIEWSRCKTPNDVDIARMKLPLQDRPDEFFIKPRAIADEIWHLVHQDRSACSFNVELRPFGENW